MCGRIVCSLSKENFQKSCCYRDKNNCFKEIQWVDATNGGKQYQASYNICPTDVTPVIRIGDAGERILQPMLWGMIPPWHKGKFNNHGLSTNNCRIENVLTSKLYKPPLVRGKRCVVACNGFYEWQTTKKVGTRQPYFVYSPQLDNVQIDCPETWRLDFTPETGWSGPQLLYIAALFDTWHSPDGEQVHSYSIVTMESDSTFSWLHDRVPAILATEEEIAAWLDPKVTSPTQAVQQLKCTSSLIWHPVSTEVNNSRNKSQYLNKAVSLDAAGVRGNKPKSKSANFMAAWLSGSKKNKRDAVDEEIEIDSPQDKKKRS